MNKYLSLLLRIAVAFILLQTLYFKFTAHPESIYIFETVGMEPFGRIGSGIVELIASVLLFVPKRNWLGAGLALGTMCGAIFFHLTTLGIEVKGDGGTLFYMAVTVAIASAVLLWGYKRQIPILNLN
ncbi:MAG TPA: DoxX family membrane protein [Cyclobacteriaceae bacterium]